ncbi:hypothetical protein BDF19DRAFT_443925 [Syncephalis fuscata]|nr:hypothetical protein BDF19DRAFT_443925 [Syncephalis fuscata]
MKVSIAVVCALVVVFVVNTATVDAKRHLLRRADATSTGKKECVGKNSDGTLSQCPRFKMSSNCRLVYDKPDGLYPECCPRVTCHAEAHAEAHDEAHAEAHAKQQKEADQPKP